jgi:Kef-type K+ transport system membrane component KefB
MPDVSFTNLLVVAAVAVLAPLTVGFAPRLRIPAVVLEIIGGIIIGPSGLGWVHVDLPVAILALFGLAFLLFLAGLEIDVHRLRGRLLRYAVLGYLVSLGLGYGASASFKAAGWVSQPLLIAITLSAAALVCAGLLSVLIFPLLALANLRRMEPAPAPAPAPAVAQPVPEPHLM